MRVGKFLVRQFSIKTTDVALDVRRQARMLLQQLLLFRGNRRKLQTERKVFFDAVVSTKKFFHTLIVVQTTCLEAGTQDIVDSGCHLMLDLVAQTDQKTQVIGRIFVDGRLLIIQAALQLPIFVCAVLGLVKISPLAFWIIVAVLDFLIAEIGM